MTLHGIISAYSFALGACVASFLNVVVWRVPRGESVVRPPSHCPRCNSRIKWYQNIPVVSYLLLRGRCAGCGERISPRYLFVELLGGALFLLAFLKLGLCLDLVVWWIWIALMIAGSFIDFDHKLLPDFVTVGGMALGVLHAAALSALGCADMGFSARALTPLFMSLAGLAFGFGLLWLIRYFGGKAFKREAMGMGDVFLMGAIGAIFGPTAVLMSLVLSSFAGSIVGVGMILLSRTRFGRFAEIPYGPYICLGCLAWMFYGPEILGWYMGMFKVTAACVFP